MARRCGSVTLTNAAICGKSNRCGASWANCRHGSRASGAIRPRRGQRSGKIEWDQKFDLVKINPIADWSSKQVWQYIREHDVPYNALHERNFPSIGCTHCTRAVRAGEDPRAGRWAGLSKTECGLHVIQAAAQSAGGDA